MAKAKSPELLRPVMANLRVTINERAHLQQVALDRSTTVSDLIRQALRREGALPAL